MSFLFVLLQGTSGTGQLTARTMNVPHPLGELLRILDGGGEKNDVDVIWQHDYNFFPNNAAL